ncbi:MAG: cytochrome c oxidase subunit 3, partial [Pseudomonadales bacterium]
MTDHHAGQETYYVPHDSKLPVWLALGLIMFMYGFGSSLNASADGGDASSLLTWAGFGIIGVVLYVWFSTVIKENHAGLASAQLKRSYVWGM